MKMNFFPNKIINTLKIISEIWDFSEPTSSHFEYYLLQILGEALPHLPNPQNCHY